MGKKSKRNRSKQSSGGSAAAAGTASTSAADPRQAPSLRQKDARGEGEETEDNLRFEDPFPEEYEDEEVDDADADEGWEDAEGEDGDDDDGGTDVIQSWHPFMSGNDGDGPAGGAQQKLEMDPAGYKMYHAITPAWPSLSFDFIRDERGESRTRFPHSLIAAVGTQADRPDCNQLTIMRLSDLSRIEAETDDDILGEEYDANKGGDDDDDDDDDESDDEVDLDPVMEHYSLRHRGGVNRIRVMPQRPNIVATWSDVGCVNLYDVETILDRFTASDGRASDPKNNNNIKNNNSAASKPFFSYSKHGTEGYALDWSPVQEGTMATGDCNGNIHVWTPTPDGGGYSVVPSYECGTFERSSGLPPAADGGSASASVEDLQWSPTEATVFAAGECGGYVRVFDTRAPKRAMLSHRIHSNGADVNVLSWNELVANLLATGGDDGVLSVWDLRHFSSSSSTDLKPLARFTPHKTPLTSVEWHPTDESMLAVTDDNGAYIYDLSVEEDDQHQQNNSGGAAAEDGGVDGAAGVVPPQLLFVHCGSEQFKEVHWHPQIPSLLMTTALSGYSVFIPSNL